MGKMRKASASTPKKATTSKMSYGGVGQVTRAKASTVLRTGPKPITRVKKK